MQRYKISKYIEACSIKDAIKKESTAKIAEVIIIEELEQTFINKKIGFR